VTTIQPGDYIHHRANSTVWRVLSVNPDGTLQVEFYAGSRGKNWRLKTISRPEEYRKLENDVSTAISNSPMA
jgi:hypothetical protein